MPELADGRRSSRLASILASRLGVEVPADHDPRWLVPQIGRRRARSRVSHGNGGANLGRLRSSPVNDTWTPRNPRALGSPASICSPARIDAGTVVADARDVNRPQRNALDRTAAGFFGATGTVLLQRPLPLPLRIALRTVAWPRWRNNIMTRQLLAIAALSIALGFSVTTTNASPASSMLETLKTSKVEGSTVEQVRHYRHYRRGHRYGNCWWQDPWLCRYMW